MLLLDANLFLAYDNENDVHHAQAVSIFKEIEAEKYDYYFTSDYVFNEVVGVTLRKYGKERAILLGEHILKSIFIFNIDEPLLKTSWKMFNETELSFNLVDCTCVILARATGAEFLATFDQEFKKVKGLKIIS